MTTSRHPVPAPPFRRRAICYRKDMSKSPEILSPAGDADAMRAAVRSGADAVYFGLQGFSARARAANFAVEDLSATMHMLHRHGVKGFVALNTLVFDHELPAMESTIRACAAAGVDAVIVQDLGVVGLVKAIAPTLHVHASTQMTCTDASSVQFARELGATRVVVARELSIDDIAKIRAETDAELEVFVHGALCVSYSGQCLTSEAIGGRSANRGACAQACRLPYDLVIDGKVQQLGDVAYLLSPQDLEASALVGRLAQLGVASLKIEGRMKGPEYVASTTKLYRAAVDGAAEGSLAALRHDALSTYSRGSGPGFLAGVNHQALVEGNTCDHRGILVGSVRAVVRDGDGNRAGHGSPRATLRVRLEQPLARGAGVLVEGGKAGRGERGGRVWDLLLPSANGTESVASAEAGAEVLVWLGPDVPLDDVVAGRRLFQNDHPPTDARIRTALERAPHREPLDVVVRGALGAPLELHATSARGLVASITSDAPLEQARGDGGLNEAVLRDKLGGLGDSPYELRSLTLDLPAAAAVPPSSLKRARRALVEALAQAAARAHETTDMHVDALLDAARLLGPLPAGGLFVLCRTLAQAEAALDAGADGVWLDFLALTGTRAAVEALRAKRTAQRRDGSFAIGVAPPRIRKPGEEKIDRFLFDLLPDAVLVRGLGMLHDSVKPTTATLFVGDFSLNITNRLSAHTVLSRGLAAFTPSFDLDAGQLGALLSSSGAYAELVIHHPMPLFHTEHCVFAALMSQGADYRSCGRPCDSHTIALRDRVGLDNPVEADVGCRNTVFHAQAQSAASQVAHAQAAGVRRFRIELVRESADDVLRIVASYRALLAGRSKPREIFQALRTHEGYGVVRGSLRVLT